MSWYSENGCKGNVDVYPYITQMQRSDTQKLRAKCSTIVDMLLLVDIAVDSCGIENSCTAGLIHDQVCQILETNFCDGCAYAQWFKSDIHYDKKEKSEYRTLHFNVRLNQNKNNNNKEITNGVRQLRQ